MHSLEQSNILLPFLLLLLNLWYLTSSKFLRDFCLSLLCLKITPRRPSWWNCNLREAVLKLKIANNFLADLIEQPLHFSTSSSVNQQFCNSHFCLCAFVCVCTDKVACFQAGNLPMQKRQEPGHQTFSRENNPFQISNFISAWCLPLTHSTSGPKGMMAHLGVGFGPFFRFEKLLAERTRWKYFLFQLLKTCFWTNSLDLIRGEIIWLVKTPLHRSHLQSNWQINWRMVSQWLLIPIAKSWEIGSPWWTKSTVNFLVIIPDLIPWQNAGKNDFLVPAYCHFDTFPFVGENWFPGTEVKVQSMLLFLILFLSFLIMSIWRQLNHWNLTYWACIHRSYNMRMVFNWFIFW